jgi:hypothetical protein
MLAQIETELATGVTGRVAAAPPASRVDPRAAHAIGVASSPSSADGPRATTAGPGRPLVTGAITRRYHGFLIAAHPAPLGRMVILNDLEVDIEFENGSVVNMRGEGRFLDFTLNMGLPSWRYELDGLVIEQ